LWGGHVGCSLCDCRTACPHGAGTVSVSSPSAMNWRTIALMLHCCVSARGFQRRALRAGHGDCQRDDAAPARPRPGASPRREWAISRRYHVLLLASGALWRCPQQVRMSSGGQELDILKDTTPSRLSGSFQRQKQNLGLNGCISTDFPSSGCEPVHMLLYWWCYADDDLAFSGQAMYRPSPLVSYSPSAAGRASDDGPNCNDVPR
jgi:hypothetical protein